MDVEEVVCLRFDLKMKMPQEVIRGQNRTLPRFGGNLSCFCNMQDIARKRAACSWYLIENSNTLILESRSYLARTFEYSPLQIIAGLGGIDGRWRNFKQKNSD